MSAADRLQVRLGTLGEIDELADGRVPPEVAVRVRATRERATGRLGHGTGHTVVALAGATGSGKSSTFNALAGGPYAATGVRRPTTSSTQAAIFTTDGELGADAAGLLDWLGVHQHVVVRDPELAGLVLLDLPDHDSTQLAHRQEVDRLVRIVDVFVWVVDPQKYADAALHRDYLRRFAGHAGVTIVVLNHIDALAPDAREAALADLARILVADGLPVARAGLVAKVTGHDEGVRVMGASARTGEGIDALRREVAARVSERRALVDRVDADLDWVADDLTAALGSRRAGGIPGRAGDQLADALAAAVGVDAVGDAVAAAHRRRGAQIAGWPPTRWLTRLRPDPLRRLGLDRLDPRRTGTEEGPQPRASLPPPSSVATAGVSTAIRGLADRSADGLPEVWRDRLHGVANARRTDLDDALDRAVGATALPTDRPRWWSVVGIVQWVLAAALAVGLIWLMAIFVVAWLNLPDLPTPKIGELPWPTVLAVGGGLAGLLLAGIARWATAVGARRRAAIARRRLRAAVGEVGQELIVRPVDAELTSLTRLHELAGRLRG